MNYNKKTVKDIDVAGKKVLLRCDFNVPQDKTTGAITDDKRIVAALPTIRYLLEQKAAVIACSHLGKPKGEWKESLSLAPVAKRLSELLGSEVIFAKDIIGEDAKAKAAALQPGQIMLLENLRFDKREEKNDPEFAKELASMAEVYVSDAFGTVHRAHASTAGVAAYLPAVSGFLIGKELDIMGKALDDPKRPFVAVLGGAKVSDKINVINNLLEKADTIIIGVNADISLLKSRSTARYFSVRPIDGLVIASVSSAFSSAKTAASLTAAGSIFSSANAPAYLLETPSIIVVLLLIFSASLSAA